MLVAFHIPPLTPVAGRELDFAILETLGRVACWCPEGTGPDDHGGPTIMLCCVRLLGLCPALCMERGPVLTGVECPTRLED